MSKYNDAALSWVDDISVTMSAGELIVNAPNYNDADAINEIINATNSLLASMPGSGPMSLAMANAAGVIAVPLSLYELIKNLNKSMKEQSGIGGGAVAQLPF